LLKIVEPAGNSFEPFQVAELGLLQTLLVRDAARERIGNSGLSEILGEILRKFPKHTIAQSAVAAFAMAVADFPDCGGRFLDVIVPIAVPDVDADAIEERGFGLLLLMNLKGKVKVEIEEEIWRKVVEIESIVERRYDGAPSKPMEAGGGGGGGSMNAQMIQIVMELLR
jgi:hypothetical protein